MSRAEHADQIPPHYLAGKSKLSLPVINGLLFQHCRGEQTCEFSHEF
jgi:hypothetical protein